MILSPSGSGWRSGLCCLSSSSCTLFLLHLAVHARQGLVVLRSHGCVCREPAELSTGSPLSFSPGRNSPTFCTPSSGRAPPTTWPNATSSRWTGACTSRMSSSRWRRSSGERSTIGTSPPSRCVHLLPAPLAGCEGGGDTRSPVFTSSSQYWGLKPELCLCQASAGPWSTPHAPGVLRQGLSCSGIELVLLLPQALGFGD